MDKQSQGQPPKPELQRRQPYDPPKLIKHGRVEEITEKVGLSTADGITGTGII